MTPVPITGLTTSDLLVADVHGQAEEAELVAVLPRGQPPRRGVTCVCRDVRVRRGVAKRQKIVEDSGYVASLVDHRPPKSTQDPN